MLILLHYKNIEGMEVGYIEIMLILFMSILMVLQGLNIEELVVLNWVQIMM